MLLLIITILWLLILYFFLFSLLRILIFRKMLKVHDDIKNNYPFVSIIIPARDEENNIRKAVSSLLSQSYPSDCYEIVVVNDNSGDDTAAVVNEFVSSDKRVKLINKGEPESGWTGKNSACFKGAMESSGDYLCFIDADTESKPDLLKASVTFALKNNIDMLTVSPFQEIKSLSEKIFLPGVFLLIASSINFTRINNPDKKDAIANGQFILFKKDVYKKTGGHSGVKSIVMEDIALASMIKEKGYRLFFIFGDNYISTRMYTGISEIWNGFSKNISAIMKTRTLFSTVLSASKSFFLGAAPVLIPLLYLMFSSDYNAHLTVLYFTGIATLITFSFFTLREMGLSPIYFIFFPLGFVLHGLISINSIFKQRKGLTQWKGRYY